MNLTYISWAPHCSRSDHTARELGGTSHMVYWEQLGSRPSTVWLKYLGQAFRTWRILRRERSSAVFVMTPPLFAVLAAWLYCRMRGCPLVIDAHTAAFLHPRWKHLQGLQFWLCRQAVTTIVTNEHLRDLVTAHGAHATIVPDVPVRFPADEAYPLDGSFNVAVVCSFNPDEPTAEILAAAARVPDVRFHVTGNARELRRPGAPPVPSNVTLTGFLSVGAYGSLLRNADAVMTLTTRDHTMLRGAWEAIYQGTPVIVSDWGLLRDAFDEGAVHVDNSVEGISRGVETLRARYEGFRRGAAALRERKERRWASIRSELQARLERA